MVLEGWNSGLQRVWWTFTGLWMLKIGLFSMPCHPEARAIFRALRFNTRWLAHQCFRFLLAACCGGGTNGSLQILWSIVRKQTFSNCSCFPRLLALWSCVTSLSIVPWRPFLRGASGSQAGSAAGCWLLLEFPALLMLPCGRCPSSGHAILSDVGKHNN